MKEKLTEFLKSKGALKKYRDNFLADGMNKAKGETFEKMFKRYRPENLVSAAFCWSSTPEGIEYWMDLSGEWERLVAQS